MNDAKPASDIMERCQQIVNQQLRSTIPKSIGDTSIQYKTVVSTSSLVPAVKIYLRTITENNKNLCQTFCIPIYIPHVCDADADIMLNYLSDKIKYSIESFLIRLVKGIIANDLSAVTDTENDTYI